MCHERIVMPGWPPIVNGWLLALMLLIAAAGCSRRAQDLLPAPWQSLSVGYYVLDADGNASRTFWVCKNPQELAKLWRLLFTGGKDSALWSPVRGSSELLIHTATGAKWQLVFSEPRGDPNPKEVHLQNLREQRDLRLVEFDNQAFYDAVRELMELEMGFAPDFYLDIGSILRAGKQVEGARLIEWTYDIGGKLSKGLVPEMDPWF
jgi:hypothetical protein